MLGYCLSDCAKTKLWYLKEWTSTALSITLVILGIILLYFIFALMAHGISVAIYGTIMFFHPSLVVTMLELFIFTGLGGAVIVVLVGLWISLIGVFIAIKRIANKLIKLSVNGLLNVLKLKPNKGALIPILIYELCPVCDNEVLLDNTFIAQQCPSCQSIIFPCSICPKPQDCRECPLEKSVNESK